MSGDRAWAAALRAACAHPEATARAWRVGGGQVVGLLGWSAPRELVAAAGMLPVRLSPARLAGFPGRGSGGAPGPNGTGGPDRASGPGGASGPSAAVTAPDHDRGSPAANIASFDPQSPPGSAAPSRDLGQSPDVAAAFGRELVPATAALAAALLSGELDWIDFLLIGRDRDDYTRLFYLLRELRHSGAAPDLIPVAFFDLLRLPSRTSARYNRQRAAELTAVIARWAGRPVTPADLAGAVEAAGDIAHSFRGIQELRARPQPAITGSDALAAAVAARILPAGELRPLLDAALAAGAPDTRGRDGAARAAAGTAPGRHASAGEASAPGVPANPPAGPAARVFLAGSATDDPAAYEALESLGLAVVGEDHEWGDDGSEYPTATRDPLDGIIDRYHFAHGAAARAGLRDRVGRAADRVRAAAADGVLYLLGPHDEAAGWELPALREHLGGIPLVPVRLRHPAQEGPAHLDPVRRDQGPAGAGGWPELREAGRRLLTGPDTPGLTRGNPGRGTGHAGPARGTAGGAVIADGAAEAGRG